MPRYYTTYRENFGLTEGIARPVVILVIARKARQGHRGPWVHDGPRLLGNEQEEDERVSKPFQAVESPVLNNPGPSLRLRYARASTRPGQNCVLHRGTPGDVFTDGRGW